MARVVSAWDAVGPELPTRGLQPLSCSEVWPESTRREGRRGEGLHTPRDTDSCSRLLPWAAVQGERRWPQPAAAQGSRLDSLEGGSGEEACKQWNSQGGGIARRAKAGGIGPNLVEQGAV
jgi:hypothetical protein